MLKKTTLINLKKSAFAKNTFVAPAGPSSSSELDAFTVSIGLDFFSVSSLSESESSLSEESFSGFIFLIGTSVSESEERSKLVSFSTAFFGIGDSPPELSFLSK